MREDAAVFEDEDVEIHTDQWDKVEKARAAIGRRIAMASAEKARRGGAILTDADFDAMYGESRLSRPWQGRSDPEEVVRLIRESGIEWVSTADIVMISEGLINSLEARGTLRSLHTAGRMERREERFLARFASGSCCGKRIYRYKLVR